MSAITIGISHTTAGRRVYYEVDGKLVFMTPAGARRFAKNLRSGAARYPDLVGLADDLDALALEVEQAAGRA